MRKPWNQPYKGKICVRFYCMAACNIRVIQVAPVQKNETLNKIYHFLNKLVTNANEKLTCSTSSFTFCERCFAECVVKVHRTPMILSTFRGHDVFFMSTSVEESPCSSSWWSIWYASMYARARCEKSRMRSMVRISLEKHCCTLYRCPKIHLPSLHLQGLPLI